MLVQASDERGLGVVGIYEAEIYARARDMAVKERRKSVASTKGASWRREMGVGGGGGKEGTREAGGWNTEAEGGGLERARIIFAGEQALPLFVVAGGTGNGKRG